VISSMPSPQVTESPRTRILTSACARYGVSRSPSSLVARGPRAGRTQPPEEVGIGNHEAIQDGVCGRLGHEAERQLDHPEEQRHRDEHEGDPDAERIRGARVR
jgi:hypothetical protein